jgi:hypothetical protein
MRLDFCALCGEADAAALEHHHFIPRALGGSDDESNMFTVCGTCHGKIHAIPRPIRLGELVKAGIAKAQERTAADYRQIERESARRTEKAAGLAKEAEKAERRIGRFSPPRLVSNNDRPQVHSAPNAAKPLLTVVKQTKMQKDKRFRVVGDWSLASDGIQWVLQRKGQALSFVRTTKSILARCMAEKETPPDIAKRLLEGLPDDFEAGHERFDPKDYLPATPAAKTVMTAPGDQLSSLAA